MGIRLVIFDFDGTIADTRLAIVLAKQETMERLGLPVADEESCTSTIGLSAKAGFQKIYPGLSESTLDECVAVYRRLFEEKKEIAPPTLFPGVAETLEALREKKIVTTIASSRNRASLDGFLIKMNIAEYFPYLLGGGDTACLKPNPEPVLKTLKELSCDAGRAMVVGDMPIDIEMGRNAGTHTCGVTYGNADRNRLLDAGAEFTIDKMTELAGVLGKI